MTQLREEKLDGWKAISEYLGKDERTVQRWRKQRQMPTYRVPGPRGGTVFAYKSELDAWLRSAREAIIDIPDGDGRKSSIRGLGQLLRAVTALGRRKRRR